MNIVISVSGNTIDSPFDARFGRASAYCIVDTESDEWTTRENPALGAVGGAGVQAAQFITKLGVQAVVSGAFGPNAAGALQAAGVAMYIAPTDHASTGSDVLALFKRGKLERTRRRPTPVTTVEGADDHRRRER